MTEVQDIGVTCVVGIGPTRGGRATNEDNFLVAQGAETRWRDGDRSATRPRTEDGRVLIAVADGMGGHEDGEIASYGAVQALAQADRAQPRQAPGAARRGRRWRRGRRLVCARQASARLGRRPRTALRRR